MGLHNFPAFAAEIIRENRSFPPEWFFLPHDVSSPHKLPAELRESRSVVVCLYGPNTRPFVASFGANLPGVGIVLVMKRTQLPELPDLEDMGVHGALLAEAATLDRLRQAVKSVAGGVRYLCPECQASVASNRQIRREPSLTPRQAEILRFMGAGSSTKEIAHALGVTIKTIETQRRRIMIRTGTDSLAGLIKYAIRTNLATL